MKKKSKTPVGSVKNHRRSTPEPQAFKNQMEPPASMAELHRLAEARLRAQPEVSQRQGRGPETATDSRRLFHELQVHQVELEMQNAELQKTRDELEVALENYTDLYDFAPSGYFTLTSEGSIRQVNLTGAQLVDAERSRLVGQPFGLLLATGFRPVLMRSLNRFLPGRTISHRCSVVAARPAVWPPDKLRFRWLVPKNLSRGKKTDQQISHPYRHSRHGQTKAARNRLRLKGRGFGQLVLDFEAQGAGEAGLRHHRAKRILHPLP